MDRSIKFFWDRRYGLSEPAADWAIHLLELGFESDAIIRLTDRHMEHSDREKFILQALNDIARTELLDLRTLHEEYERENVSEFFAGNIDGWELIYRCCSQYWIDSDLDPDRVFWIILAEQAAYPSEYRAWRWEGKCGEAFDEELKSALRESNRPMPKHTK